MKKIAVIGAGNMGSAIVNALQKKYMIIASDADVNKLKRLNVRTTSKNIDAVEKADIIILAIKPQNMETVLEEIAGKVTPKQMVISIAAGITTKKIENKLGKIPVIRAMPNTPLLVGEGMSAIYAGKYAKTKHIRDTGRIFSNMGKVIYLKKEGLIDTVTAISGSGPAYVYLFIESLVSAGINLGLGRDVAKELVTQTLKGALSLLEKTGESPEELRKKVTSPKGTTEAAIKVFQKKGFNGIINNAINAAFRRAKELSK